MDYYTQKATVEEIAGILMLWKVCVAHARELDEAQQRKEIERTVA